MTLVFKEIEQEVSESFHYLAEEGGQHVCRGPTVLA